MPALKKALAALTSEDLTQVLLEEWPEDEQLEFKGALPTAEGVRADRWVTHGDAINDPAKRGVFKEVVAFANSYGGDLIIGISESEDNPKRAAARSPVPRCVDLAERLAMAARSLIEPEIPRLEVRGIPVDDSGDGYVIFRVPRSRLAPHRLTMTKECYRRRRDSTEAMTMREIQDLTFNVARGLEAVERRMQELQRAFDIWATRDRVFTPGLRAVAIGVRGVPASSDLYVERVHDVKEITPSQLVYHCTLGDDRKFELNPLCSAHAWRPILRGTQAEDGEPGRVGKRNLLQLYSDGAVVYQFSVAESADDQSRGRPSYILYPGWLFGLLLNALDTVDRFRSYAGAHSVEYVFEIEVYADADVPVYLMNDGHGWNREAGKFAAGSSVLPRYTVGDAQSRHATLNLVWRDFWNSIGRETPVDQLKIV